MIRDSLPPEFEEFVEQELASGRYLSADEVVCEGLRLLRDREQRLAELRKDIDVGWAQMERGEVIEIETERAHQALFDDIKARGMMQREALPSG